MFKRYIKKHGKKLGPYYYHNVRGSDGKIKSVYVGTNPQNHPKHRIRKPLFSLILVLVLILILGGSLFFLQNKAVLLNKSENANPNFDVDQILLKVLVKSGDYFENRIKVMNTGNEQSKISIEVSGLSDIVSADSKEFTLKPGQTKILSLNFSSIIPNENIEQQPGIYVGKLVLRSEKATREVPVVVEIETKDVLFDMNLNPVAIERRVKQGEDTTIEVKVFNLETIESVNVDVEYFVKDMSGNTIVTESETVVVKSQASFFKTISVPKNLNPGTYVFAAKAKFGNSVGTASYMFEVTGPESQQGSFAAFCKSSVLCLGLSMTAILLIFAVVAYLYFYFGAYLYEKLTGTATLGRKAQVEEETIAVEEAPAEKPRQSAFSGIADKIRKWREEREKEKLQKESAERKRELQNLQQERIIQLEASRKQKEIEAQALEELKKRQILKKQREIGEKKAEQERLRREEEEKKQKALEDKNKAEEKKKARLERQKLIKQKKREIKDFFHRIGIYKTPEEKRQIALQKEKEKQEKLKREEEEKKQVELEKKRIEQDKLRKDEEEGIRKAQEERKKQEDIESKERLRRKEETEKKEREEAQRRQMEEERRRKEEEEDRRLEAEHRKQAEERKKEEIAKQKELEGQKREEEKKNQEIILQKQKELEENRKKIEVIKREEEEKRRKKEELKRKEEDIQKKEQEKRKEDEIRKQKFELIKQFKLKLSRNKEADRKLAAELNSLESEKRIVLNKLGEAELQIQDLHREIEEKSMLLDKFLHQKGALIQSHQMETESRYKKQKEMEQQHGEKAAKLSQELAEKEAKMMNEMQQELSKLSPDKREAAEHWKKLEIKAKLKLEEQKIQTELKSPDKSEKYNQKGEESYKEKLQEMNNNEHNLKRVIAGLKSQINALRLEKKNSPDNMAGTENKIQIIRKKLEILVKEREQINKELAIANLGLSKLRLDYFKNMFFTILDRREKLRQQKAKEKARMDDEKKKMEAELQKQKSREERLRKIDEERKKKEEEKRVKDENRRAEKEKKSKLLEEQKGQKETERQRQEEERKNQRLILQKETERQKAPPAAEAKEQAKEKKPEAGTKEKVIKNLAGRSRDFGKCFNLLESARKEMGANKNRAKELYAKAREIYVGLDYHEKKEIYNELMELYNELLK